MVDSSQNIAQNGKADAVSRLNDGGRSVIERPPAGGLRVVDVNRIDAINFGFDFSSAKVFVVDVDIVLVFPDGAKLVLPGMGLAATGPNPPLLKFGAEVIAPEQLLGSVTDVNLKPAVPALAVSGGVKDAGQASADPNAPVTGQGGEPAAVASAPAPLVKIAAPLVRDEVLTPSVDVPTIGTRTIEYVLSAPKGRGSSEALSEASNGSGMGDVPLTGNLTFKLFNIEENTILQGSGGGIIFNGGTGGLGSASDASYDFQATPRSASSTGFNDLVNLDSPDLANIGSSARRLDVLFSTSGSTQTGWQAASAVITGLPAGYEVTNGSVSGNGFLVYPDESEDNKFQLNLSYRLPAEGQLANEDGVYESFTVTMVVHVVSANATRDLTVTRTFVVRDVNSAADMTYIDPLTRENVVVLWANPPGSSVDLGVGDDTVTSGAGADTMAGGDGSDTLSYERSQAGVTVSLATRQAQGGFARGDRILDGFENLTGSAKADILTGDAGNNKLIGLDGADTMNGGIGSDTADYAGSTAGVTVDLGSAGAQSGGDAAGDVLSNIENVIGSATQANQLTGDAQKNRLTGGQGNDTFVGGAEADTLIGNGGTDIADYSGSTAGVTINLSLETAQVSQGDANGDVLQNITSVIGASQHANWLRGNNEKNSLTGGEKNDTFLGDSNADTMWGGGGNDSVDYGESGLGVAVDLASADAQSGGSAEGDILHNISNVRGSLTGANVLKGTEAGNRLTGGNNADVFEGRGGADTIEGGGGFNEVIYTGSSEGVTANLVAMTISGGEANGDVISEIQGVTGARDYANWLKGNVFANRLIGGEHDDTFIGDKSGDTLTGYLGTDLVDYSNSDAGVTVNLSTVGIQSGGYAEGDVLTGIENIKGALNYVNSLAGDGGANVLTGGTLNDTFAGDGGDDTLIGGAGTDLADYSASTLGVTIDLAAGMGSGGDAQGDQLIDIENVLGAASAANSLAGNDQANVLTGGAGNDTLIGRGGADTFVGGGGVDIVDYWTSALGVRVSLAGAVAHGGDAEGDVLSGILNLRGSATGDNSLAGDAQGNVITGGAGSDTIAGNGGHDTLIGGDGAGFDYLDYSASGIGITINLAANTASGGDADGDVISGFEGVIGSASQSNFFSGDNLANKFVGGAGADTFNGDLGNDTFQGGGGSDVVSYANSSASVTVDLGGGGSGGYAAGDIYLGINNAIGAALWASKLVGNEAANVLTGGDLGDTLSGGVGADTLKGGDGVDLVDYSGSAHGVTVDLSGSSQTDGDAAGDVIESIENVTGALAFENWLKGDGRDNVLTGGGINDTLIGGNGNDTLVGLGGRNYMKGGVGADCLVGGDDRDVADYSEASSSVTIDLGAYVQSGGDAQGDIFVSIEDVVGAVNFGSKLIGNADDNSLTGWGFNDTFIGGAGNDSIDGGAGTDLVDYSGSIVGITADLELESVIMTGGESDRIIGIENIYGGSILSNSIKGNGLDNYFVGGTGKDTLMGRGGRDTLDGGAENDTADYSYVTTGAAGLTVTLNRDADITVTVAVGEDVDVLRSIENFIGTALNDSVTGDILGNVLTGGGGNDTLAGGQGADTLIGTGGFAVADYSASAAAVAIDLDTTNIQATGDALGDLLINILGVIGSLAGNNMLSGNSQDNLLQGGNVNDTLIGLGGADTLKGMDGTDLADYWASSVGVSVDLGVAGAQSGGDAQGDILSGIENLRGSQTGANTLRGDGGANLITGGLGNDVIAGGGGLDTLVGGGGTDTADYSQAYALADTTGLVVTMANGAAIVTVVAGSDVDNISGFRNFTGSIRADNITGDDFDNKILGGLGDDTLNGGLGNDTLDGGGGNDLLTGGDGGDRLIAGVGNETLRGGAGSDTLDGTLAAKNLFDYSDLIGATDAVRSIAGAGPSGTVTVAVTRNGTVETDVLIAGLVNEIALSSNGDQFAFDEAGIWTVRGGVGHDTLRDSGSAANTVYGDEGNDSLSRLLDGGMLDGGIGNDTLSGGAGAQLLRGGTGDDCLSGQAGNDTLDGGGDNDWADYSYIVAGAGISVTLNSAATYSLTVATGDTDSLINIRNFAGTGIEDTIIGDAQANSIKGGGGRDSLSGGAGNDTIMGGAAEDTIDGGAGLDVVDYSDSAIGLSIQIASNGAVTGANGGDSLTSTIDGIIGSNFNDTLKGAGMNVGGFYAGGIGDDSIYVGGSSASSNTSNNSGALTLSGGDGTDTLDYSLSGSAWTFNIAAGTVTTSTPGVLTAYISGFEKYVDNTNSGLFLGTSAAESFDGGQGVGNETFRGVGGADSFNGGGGQADLVDYSYATASLTITAGTKMTLMLVTGSADANIVEQVESYITGSGNDSLKGEGNNNLFQSGFGNDTLSGSGGSDTLNGGDDMDVADFQNAVTPLNITLNSSATIYVNDGLGIDQLISIEGLIGSALGDALVGDTVDNYLNGLGGDDSLFGDVGSDTILGGTGADTIDGGIGTDIANFSYSAANLNLYLNSGGAVTFTNAGDADVLQNIEGLIGGSGNDSISGDTLAGNTSTNYLDGGLGNDTLEGYGGNDTLIGGSGLDVADYTYLGALNLRITLSANPVTLVANDVDTLISIEGLITDLGNDCLVGNGEVNYLSSNGGNDTLYGFGGNDTLAPGAGADSVYGGDGMDVVDYSFLSTAASMSVSLNSAATVNTGPSNGSKDNWISIEGVIGGAAGDTLIGDGVSNYLSGNGGNDSLSGGGDNDTLIGGAGSDTLTGDAGSADIADYSSSAAGVTIDLNSSAAQTGGDALGDIISTIEYVTGSAKSANRLTGSGEDNRLTGGVASDSIAGGDGNDTLIGGGGADTLNGDAGNDILSFSLSAIAATGATLKADGGNDSDTVLINASSTATGAALAAAITNVEFLDFRSAGVTATITSLTGAQVVSMSGASVSGRPDVKELTINIDAGDSVAITDSQSSFIRSGSTTDYNFYSDASNQNLIAQLHVVTG